LSRILADGCSQVRWVLEFSVLGAMPHIRDMPFSLITEKQGRLPLCWQAPRLLFAFES